MEEFEVATGGGVWVAAGARPDESSEDNWVVEAASYTITSTGRALRKKWNLN